MNAHIVVLMIALAGFVALALGMDRHAREVLGAAPSPARRKALRAAGWTALASALALCLWIWGGSVGAVEWFAVLSAVAVPWVLLGLPRWAERTRAATPVRRPVRAPHAASPAAPTAAIVPAGGRRRALRIAGRALLLAWPVVFLWALVQAL